MLALMWTCCPCNLMRLCEGHGEPVRHGRQSVDGDPRRAHRELITPESGDGVLWTDL